jgi:flagellar biosynthetic protein FliQ
MDQGIIMDYGREAIMLTLKLGAPVMIVALVVGVLVGLLQALTQIQEMTLSFVPKIIAIFLALFAALPYMGGELMEFTRHLADQIIGMPIN